MGRTATNVLGNGIATGVVAKWENALGTETEEEEEEALRAPSPVPVAAE
jgi:Na+/H+-dicarboxylate symporter